MNSVLASNGETESASKFGSFEVVPPQSFRLFLGTGRGKKPRLEVKTNSLIYQARHPSTLAHRLDE